MVLTPWLAMPRGYTGRVFERVVQVRLTADQGEAIRHHARLRKSRESTALRELLDVGILHARAMERGLVVTKRAIELLTAGHGAAVAYGAFEGYVDEHVVRILDLSESERHALDGGAVVMATTEQLDAIREAQS
jgi:hypothetical protein